MGSVGRKDLDQDRLSAMVELVQLSSTAADNCHSPGVAVVSPMPWVCVYVSVCECLMCLFLS